MGTMIDITQKELNQALANEEVDAKIKLRRLSHANLIEHVKNIPFKGLAGPDITSSKFNLPEEQLNINILPEKNIQLVSGNDKPINVKEEKLNNIRKHSDDVITLAIEKQNAELVQNEEVKVELSEENIIPTPVVDEEPVQQDVAQEEETVVSEENTIINENDTNINTDTNINDYIARMENETQLLKKLNEEVEIAQKELDASDEEVNKLMLEVNELEKKEAEIQKRNAELDQQIAAAYEQQCRIQAINREEKKSLLEEIANKKIENDNRIVEFNTRKSSSVERIAIGSEALANKEAILAAVLPQNNFIDVNSQDDVIQFSTMDEEEEMVKRRVA